MENDKISENNVKICKTLDINYEENKIIFTVVAIDLGIKEKKGIRMLTGDFAGELLPTIGEACLSNTDYCVWTEDVSDIQKVIPTHNLDDIRDVLEELLIEKQFVKYYDDSKIYPIKESEEKNEEELLNMSKEKILETKENISLSELINKIKKSVISQDSSIEKIATALYSNQKIFSSTNLTEEQKFQAKKNILIIGQTGTGKTEIIRQLAKILTIPYIIVDANDYTISGYKGKDVDSILTNLLSKTSNNYEKAKKGIVIIDEIDKLGKSQDVSSIATDGVQKSLLKMVEGANIDIERSSDRPNIMFDTSQLTFIFAGAFSELFEENKFSHKTVGFNNQSIISDTKKMITQEELIKYGLIPEFIGRISVVVQLNDLSEQDYRKIISKSELSILNIMINYYKSLGVTLTYDEDFISKVATETVKLKTGARGIKTILTDIFNEIDIEVLNGNLKNIKLTKENVSRVRKTTSES